MPQLDRVNADKTGTLPGGMSNASNVKRIIRCPDRVIPQQQFLRRSRISSKTIKEMSASTEPDDWIKVEYLGRIAVITLNRPEKLNALPKDGFYQLSQRLREVDTHAEVTITVLLGKGRFFSACVYIHPSQVLNPQSSIPRPQN